MTRRETLIMWCAWRELNAIRARDGAPGDVSETYFSWLVDQMSYALGPQYDKPWEPEIGSQFTKAFFSEVPEA